MAMRVSGINSGLDTDSIVQELVSAYNTKTEKYQKEQTKLSELEKNSPESIYKLIFTEHKGKETVNNEQ